MISKDEKIKIASWLLDPGRRRPPRGSLEALERKVKSHGLDKVYRKIELPLAPVLRDIEAVGFKVNLAYLGKISKELKEKINTSEKKIYKSTKQEFNLNSPAQLSEILFKKLKINSGNLRRTKTGLISTNEETLQLIKNRHPVIKLILEYRTLFKLKSTYTDPLLKMADDKGRVHTTFLQTGTATGRLSSRNPNLQNIPASGDWAKKIRRAFVADRGYSLVSFDYSQMELRILAALSRDRNLMAAFKNGKDIHSITAARIFGVPLGKVTKNMRRIAKTLNFGMNYGMGANAFSRVAGVSVKEAREFIKKHFEYFSSVKEWQEKIINQARALGYVENKNGRRRLLPDINSQKQRSRAEAERAAINMPIQGLNADIIKLAMVRVAKELKKRGWWRKQARLLLTIHDELLFEIKDPLIKKASKIIRDIMENIYKLDVPLKVDEKTGGNWGMLK